MSPAELIALKVALDGATARYRTAAQEYLDAGGGAYAGADGTIALRPATTRRGAVDATVLAERLDALRTALLALAEHVDGDLHALAVRAVGLCAVPRRPDSTVRASVTVRPA